MWWKLAILTVVTVLLVVAVIPVRTHAVKWDIYNEPPPPQNWSLSGMLHAMYLTPTTVALIAGILIVAAATAFWIVRTAR